MCEKDRALGKHILRRVSYEEIGGSTAGFVDGLKSLCL